MSSWQLHGVINSDMGLQTLNLLMKVKTETENKLAESYMKKQSPQTSTCAQHSCLSSQAAADVISQAEKQMLALSPRLLTFHHSSHEFSYDCMSLKKQILPFCSCQNNSSDKHLNGSSSLQLYVSYNLNCIIDYSQNHKKWSSGLFRPFS